MDICLCEVILTRRIEAARALARDINLPRRGPRGSQENIDRILYVLKNHPALLDTEECPLHGNFQRFYSKVAR